MIYPSHLAAILLMAGVAAAGCATVGPDYTRPKVDVTDTYRGQATETTSAPSIADEPWANVFVDEPLRALVTTALKQNYDVRIAATRVMQARAQYGITRSNQFPSIDALASGQGQRSSLTSRNDEPETVGFAQLGASVNWEVDFWGKFRRATEAARAEILATEWGRRAVMTSVVSDVAAGYYQLLSLDLEMSIATRTLASREESLRITQIREAGGATSLVDVRQAEQLVLGARATIVDLQRRIEQQENFLSLLLGNNPGAISRGRPLTEQPHPPDVPAGLPSALLERRPDIQQAEQLLVAANADIGVAKAAYFPQVTLTGSGGVASTALTALFSGPAAAWTVAASALQPIFNAGRLRSGVELAESRQQEAALAYQQIIKSAFREVADALVGYRRAREFRETQEQLVTSAQDARRLADLRYQGGATSYLEVLDSDTRLFSAELDLAEAQQAELATFVEIYRALGGGWRE
jgi:multidrug efflux system outer membrane protein